MCRKQKKSNIGKVDIYLERAMAYRKQKNTINGHVQKVFSITVKETENMWQVDIYVQWAYRKQQNTINGHFQKVFSISVYKTVNRWQMNLNEQRA